MSMITTPAQLLDSSEHDSELPNNVVVIDVPIETYRSYDHKRGDARRFTQDEAIALARLRVRDRGCRQQVRRVRVQPGDEALTPVWLIQDI